MSIIYLYIKKRLKTQLYILQENISNEKSNLHCLWKFLFSEHSWLSEKSQK
jgi:hypothetical protein